MTLYAHAFQRWRLAASALAAALALTFFVATPMGQTAAAQFLAQFRSQKFTAVPVDQQGARALSGLEHIGTISGAFPEPGQAETVGTLAEASQRVGFQVKAPDPATLPAGIERTPTIRVTRATQVRFTFDRARFNAWAQSIARPDLSLPAELDGASLVVSVPAGALLDYRNASAPAQPASNGAAAPTELDSQLDRYTGLLVGQIREVEVGVEGSATLDQVRDFLLGLPLPQPTVDALRNIQDWRTTVPVFVPMNTVTWQEAPIAGTTGLVLADSSGIGSGAIFSKGGIVYGVAGTGTTAEILRVANSLP